MSSLTSKAMRIALASIALATGAACGSSASTGGYVTDPPTETTTSTTWRPTTKDFGSDIAEDADPGPTASVAQRCAAVMPGATRQEIVECVALYGIMKK